MGAGALGGGGAACMATSGDCSHLRLWGHKLCKFVYVFNLDKYNSITVSMLYMYSICITVYSLLIGHFLDTCSNSCTACDIWWNSPNTSKYCQHQSLKALKDIKGRWSWNHQKHSMQNSPSNIWLPPRGSLQRFRDAPLWKAPPELRDSQTDLHFGIFGSIHKSPWAFPFLSRRVFPGVYFTEIDGWETCFRGSFFKKITERVLHMVLDGETMRNHFCCFFGHVQPLVSTASAIAWAFNLLSRRCSIGTFSFLGSPSLGNQT